MLRVKDPQKSIAFYQALGMKVLEERTFSDFSLYFLGSSNVDESVPARDQPQPVLELTHNHGTENDDSFQHYNGNEEGRQGFGHIGFLVDDVYKACDEIEKLGYGFRKTPDGGSMKGLAFAYVSGLGCSQNLHVLFPLTFPIVSFQDPDGYSVEIIKRGGIDFGDVKKE